MVETCEKVALVTAAALRLGIPPKTVTKEIDPCATKLSLGLLTNTVKL